MFIRKASAVILFLGLVLNAGIVFAHPAKDTLLSFDNKTATLNVSILHDSRDNKKHFIDDIDVSVNGKVVIKQSFKSQADNKKQDVSYVLIDVKPGDEIAVKSECNLGGIFEKKIIIK